MAQPMAGSCEERMYIKKRSGSRRNPPRSYTVMTPRLTSVVIRLEMATKTSASTLAPPVIFMRQLRSRSSWLLSSEKRLSITSVCLSIFASIFASMALLASLISWRTKSLVARESSRPSILPMLRSCLLTVSSTSIGPVSLNTIQNIAQVSYFIQQAPRLQSRSAGIFNHNGSAATKYG